MSRLWEIDLDRPLSDEDREYLQSRSGHEHYVTQNEDRFSGESPAESDPGPNLKDQIEALSDKDLDKALKDRELPTSGKKKDKQKRLMEYVLENEADEDEDDDGEGDDGGNAN